MPRSPRVNATLIARMQGVLSAVCSLRRVRRCRHSWRQRLGLRTVAAVAISLALVATHLGGGAAPLRLQPGLSVALGSAQAAAQPLAQAAAQTALLAGGSPSAFSDLDGHWAGPVVSLLAARRIVSGFADGLYYPARVLTRAEFAKLSVAGLGGEATAAGLATAAPIFADLTGHWARGWIAAGRELGLLRGLADGLFYPDAPMDRAQVTTVLVRALGWEAEATALTAAAANQILSAYADAAAVPDWARPYMAIGAQRGLIRGYDDRTLRPSALVTRAEAATFLARALDRLALLYDIGGTLREVEPGGSVVLSGVWGWAQDVPDDGALPTLRLPTSARTTWLRNGHPVEPAALVPGDRVVAIMGGLADGDGITAPALCIVAMAWDLYGQLVGVDSAAGTLRMRLGDDSVVTLALNERTEAFKHAQPVSVSTLEPGDRVYALLDPLTGYLSLVDAVRPEAQGIIAATGRIGDAGDGAAYVDIVPPAPGDPAAAPPPPQRFILAQTAAIFVGGLTAAADDLAPGMAVLLAGSTAPDGPMTYCEAWEPAVAVSAGAPASGDAGDVLGGAPRIAPTAVAAIAPPDDWRYVAHIAGPAPAQQDEVAWLPGVMLPRAALNAGWPADAGLGISVRATGADRFWSAYGADGTGVRIAVIDTGIDPTHPLLMATTAGPGAGPDAPARKVVDWVDFTGEGRVDTLLAATAHAGWIATRLGPLRIGVVESRSGIYRSGVIDESKLPGEYGPGVDLDANGRTDDRFAVVLVDTVTPGVYDTVLIDTNRNLDLRDEQPLTVYRDGGASTRFGRPGQPPGAGVVVADIDRVGYHVTLGWDGNGHGTHVAGIAAGHDPTSWHPVVGMAPGASLMALKALGSDGSGTWNDIRRAVEYAGSRGAHIVILAVEAPSQGDASHADLNAIAAIAAQRGMLAFIAGGNSGPGTGTAVSSPDPEILVPVGGYLSSAMWADLMGYDAPAAPWLYNSAGPAAGSGGLAPLFLAPAVAVSGVPFAAAVTGFEMYEGTSMAVPHAAGAAALLLDYARRNGQSPRPRSLSRALADGAQPLAGLTPAEQGFGVMDVLIAAERLVPGGGTGALQVTTAGGLGSIHERMPANALPVTWPLLLTNRGQTMLALSIETLLGKVSVPQEAVFVPAGRTRELQVQPAPGHVPGDADLSDLVILRDLATGELAGHLLLHLPERHVLAADGTPLVLAGLVDSGRLERRFLEVPLGAAAMELTVFVDLDQVGRPKGRLQAYLYSPTGHLVADSGPIGLDTGAPAFNVTLTTPPPGVWELVVWGAPEAGMTAEYALIASAASVRAALSPHLVVGGTVLGQPQNATVTLTVEATPSTPALFVEALGWMPADTGPVTVYHCETVYGTANRIWTLPPVPRDTGLLEVWLTGLRPGDADLALYHLRTGPQGSWLDAGSSRRAGVTAERLMLWHPEPGQYAAVAEGRLANQTLDVAFAATRWPAGTMILDQGQMPVPAEGVGTRTLELTLPLPAAAGAYHATIILRDVVTMVPIIHAPVRVELAMAGAVVVVAPRLAAVSAYTPGGELANALVRVLSGTTLTPPAAAQLFHDGRMAAMPGGTLRLSEALLGVDAMSGGMLGVEAAGLLIDATGLALWHGDLRMPGPGAPRDLAPGGEVSGVSPFGWPEGSAGQRTALRRKVSLLSRY